VDGNLGGTTTLGRGGRCQEKRRGRWFRRGEGIKGAGELLLHFRPTTAKALRVESQEDTIKQGVGGRKGAREKKVPD